MNCPVSIKAFVFICIYISHDTLFILSYINNATGYNSYKRVAKI